MGSLEHILRFPTKWLVNMRFWEFLIWLMDMFLFYDFGTPKTTQKITTALWKRCGIRQIYFHCLKYMSRFLTKLFSFFCHIFECFWGYVPSYDFGTPKITQKTSIALWKRCRIRQIYFRCLKYMLMVLKKLWFKFFLLQLWIFLR